MTEIWQEPARGGFAPEGFNELPGIDRARAVVQGLVPRPPINRLLGVRVTHASVGSATAVMAASPWLQKTALVRGMAVQGVLGTIEVLPLAAATMSTAALTTAPAGKAVGIHTFGMNYIRRPTVAMESFVARARCLAAGPSRATVEVQIEDAEGRLVVHSTGQVVIATSSNAPRASSPPPLERVVEPSYPTPDPSARPLGDADHGVPLWQLMGITLPDFDAGQCTLAMRPIDWLRGTYRNISPSAVKILLSSALYSAAPILAPLRGMVEHELHMAFLHGNLGPMRLPHSAEGELVARARVESQRGDTVFVTGEVTSEAGDRVLAGSAVSSMVEAPTAPAEVSRDRVLAAVLYTDIVGSTPHAERLGDAGWKDLLEEFHARSSKHVSAFRGREVKWTGDGLLAMFDSPARAVQCARALREAAQRQNMDVRTGIHVGECELMGADVTGIAVHVAHRVLDAADPGSIYVTSTVREAAAGSGLRFADRGRRSLKGIEGEWQLYAVDD